MPAYASNGAACFDIYALDAEVMDTAGPAHAKSIIFSTGLKFDVPEGWVLRIYSRSGHGFKKDLRLANCVGIIDSDYTGEVKVKLTADSEEGMNDLFRLAMDVDDEIKTAVAQGEFAPVEYVEFTEGKVDKQTDRGSNGFGSTDQKAT